MKKRILSLALVLVMLVGMIPATSLTAFAASTSVTGVDLTGGEYFYYETGSKGYTIPVENVMAVSGTSKVDVDGFTKNGHLYSNEACTYRLTEEPVLDETYYFVLYFNLGDSTNNIADSNSTITVDGFYNGEVVSATATAEGEYTVICSVTYGELTGGVKAVASGVEYDSAEGGYAPTFTTLKAVSTEGKELEHTMVDGKYSHYGAKSGCLYKTNSGTSFSNMLTTEPQMGETYYSYFLLDSIDGNLNIEEDLVDIQIPGYEVEYLASYERDMGFTSLIVYSVTKLDPKVYVGGVGMYDGDYLAVGATKTQTTKPSGGYAYYKNGKLTLNNYSYEGKGYQHVYYYAVIYTENDLTLELIGNNTLTQTDDGSDMIYVVGAKLTVGGNGKLTGTAEGFALFADRDITINGGTVEVSTDYACVYSYGGDVIINGGDITAESKNRTAIYSEYDITINGGNVTATGTDQAIGCSGLTVAKGMKIQASTTVDGALGEYVSANHDSYKKIVIKTPGVYVGGVGMYDGDYLAVGATATQTTKPSGGYTYYKNGKLTLNNYSYEGKGYQYASLGLYATVYANQDLTLELIGNNTLTQTDSDSDMIYVDGAKLTVGGDGKLTGTSRGYALYAYKDITINGGTIELSTYYTSILSSGDVIINGGDITAESEDRAAIYSYYDVTVNGGNVTAIGGNNAIDYGSFGSFTVAEDMNIQVYVSDTNDFASATKWDRTTDISDYNCVWIVEELQSAELIKWVGTQLQATSNLDMQFALRVSDLGGTTGNYIVLTRTYADGRADDVVTIPQEKWTTSSSFYIVAYSGIAAKEMGDVISAVAYNADGDVISETRSESIVTYALSMLGKITNPEQKTMFVDLLNYGAEAQKFFHYNESNLANAGLTEAQKALGTQGDIEVADHRVKGTNFFGSNLSLENVILLQMAFKVTPVEGMYAVVTYTDHNGKAVNEKLAVINNSGYTMVSINSLAIADYRVLVSCTVYDADGNVVGSATDSMESYVARSNTDLGKAIMRFGASAYAYFH